MGKEPKIKFKKTCRCKCGKKYRPEFTFKFETNAAGEHRMVKNPRPTCIGWCSRCHDLLMKELGEPDDSDAMLRNRKRKRK